MPTTRLSRSTPFWVLVGGSVAATAGGAYLLISKLSGMDAGLTDGTATTSDVYVGQIWAVVGAILVGAGLIGFALALTLGALRALAAPPVAAVEVIEPPAWEEEAVEVSLPDAAAVEPVAAVADSVAESAEPAVEFAAKPADAGAPETPAR